MLEDWLSSFRRRSSNKPIVILPIEHSTKEEEEEKNQFLLPHGSGFFPRISNKKLSMRCRSSPTHISHTITMSHFRFDMSENKTYRSPFFNTHWIDRQNRYAVNKIYTPPHVGWYPACFSLSLSWSIYTRFSTAHWIFIDWRTVSDSRWKRFIVMIMSIS